uniref:uncharacterized protein LOC120812058 isoform X1 n=3 Tax=Gasterosteus aculeatus aculeatus TaxID=481459 RepID=UPI001A98AE2F|nr:uncharacterized protein LOC120812058 isoform X1 [Gasterosteus aculeatus aculeatus]
MPPRQCVTGLTHACLHAGFLCNTDSCGVRMLWKCKYALEACKDLVDEMQKRTPNGPLVKQKMDQTFALRRKEVVESEPAISTMVRRWPALFTEDQVFMEFSRIVGKNLKTEFYESIDRHSPRLLELFGSKRGNVGQLLTHILQQTNTTEPTAIRTQVLRGLPIILGDNPTDFFKAGFESDDDDSFRDPDIGILLIEREGAVLTSSQHLSPASLEIIIEGEVVMDNIQDLPKAMCILFGLMYALHLNYPKTMKLTFQFIQQGAPMRDDKTAGLHPFGGYEPNCFLSFKLFHKKPHQKLIQNDEGQK